MADSVLHFAEDPFRHQPDIVIIGDFHAKAIEPQVLQRDAAVLPRKEDPV